MSWIYKGEEIKSMEDVPRNAIGFVYLLSHIPSGKKYVGKKNLYEKRTLPPLKGKKRKRKIVRESKWLTYNSSSKEVQELLEESGGEHEFRREILEFAYSSRELTYKEVKHQFIKEVLEKDEFINANILGRFFKGNLL